MSDIVLSVKGLGKSYISYSSNLSRFASWFGYPSRHTNEHWAVRDVSFTLTRGEAIGLIGKNGAGKSSLLKLIAGTVRQTDGTISLNGKVSAILELGLGFNPDLTGIQNIHLAGGMMGFSTEEILDFIPDVRDFADLGKFFEEPLRLYSSGMKARLAFALATCRQPDLFIVDEALSVGDMAFQRKCFRRIEGFLETGTALLFVSHDIESVRRICNKVVYLKDSRAIFLGDPKTGCDLYERDAYGTLDDRGAKTRLAPPSADVIQVVPLPVMPSEVSYGNGDAEILDCWIETHDGTMTNIVSNGDPFVWCYRVIFHRNVSHPIFGMRLKAVDGVDIFSTNTTMLNAESRSCDSDTEITVRFKLRANLAPNVYFLNAGISEKDPEDQITFLHRRVDAKSVKVVSRNSAGSFGGIADLSPAVEIEERPTNTCNQSEDDQ